MRVAEGSSPLSAVDEGLFEGMDWPVHRFDVEESDGEDKGSKGKERETSWTEVEQSALGYAPDSEGQLELDNDERAEDGPCQLHTAEDAEERVRTKHESTASSSSTTTKSSSSLDRSEPLSPASLDTDITAPDPGPAYDAPLYRRKIALLATSAETDWDCKLREYTETSGTLPDATCTICRSHIEGRVTTLFCGHQYDVNCLLDMFLLNVNDETVFPPRCCGQTISHDLVSQYLHQDIIELFEAKIKEVTTVNRLYCANIRCSRFLGSRNGAAMAVQCPSCELKTCSSCRQPDHPETTKCKPDSLVTKTLVLAQSHGWQRCPTCRTLVERNMGCSHISCRCGAHWCYGCGRVQGSCECWTHVRLPRRILRWVLRRNRRAGVRQDSNYLLASEAVYVGAIEPSKPALVRVLSEPWKKISKAIRVSSLG